MTDKPVLGPHNAIRAAQSTEFAEFSAVYAAYAGEPLEGDDFDPAALWLIERDNYMIVQSHEPGDEEAWYFVIGHAGGRPFRCHVQPDETTDARAAELGLTVTFHRYLQSDTPPEPGSGHRLYHGPEPALLDFVLDQLTHRTLACEFPAPDD